jgi:hypothetical protein
MLVQAVAAALSRSLLAPTIARFGQKTTMLMVITTCEAHEVIVSSWCRQHESVTNRSMSLLRVRNVAAALSECQKPAVGVARRLAWLMTYKQPAHEIFYEDKTWQSVQGRRVFSATFEGCTKTGSMGHGISRARQCCGCCTGHITDWIGSSHSCSSWAATYSPGCPDAMHMQ